MKNILLVIILISISNTILAQNGYKEFIKRFYSKIDSAKTLKCCDSNHHGFSLVYEIPLLELPYEEIDLVDYEEKNSSDGFVDSYVMDLIDGYYNMNPSLRKKITRSCYDLSVSYNITKNIKDEDLYWIGGTLKVKISFQGEEVNFCLPWWKRVFYKFR